VRHDFPIFGGAIWAFGRRAIEWLFLSRARLCRGGRQKQSAPERRLPPEERKDQTQHDANYDAGDNWEIERAVAALDADIAGQTSEPAGANAGPEQKAKNNDYGSEDDQKFSELGHAVILVDHAVVSSEVETSRESYLKGHATGSLDWRSG
jgi:hypothetical protein